jgi:hypothetical protein
MRLWYLYNVWVLDAFRASFMLGHRINAGNLDAAVSYFLERKILGKHLYMVKALWRESEQYYYLLKDRDIILLLTAGPCRGSSRKWRSIPFRGLPPAHSFATASKAGEKENGSHGRGFLGHAQARSTTAGTRVQTTQRPKSGPVRDCLTRYSRSGFFVKHLPWATDLQPKIFYYIDIDTLTLLSISWQLTVSLTTIFEDSVP